MTPLVPQHLGADPLVGQGADGGEEGRSTIRVTGKDLHGKEVVLSIDVQTSAGQPVVFGIDHPDPGLGHKGLGAGTEDSRPSQKASLVHVDLRLGPRVAGGVTGNLSGLMGRLSR